MNIGELIATLGVDTKSLSAAAQQIKQFATGAEQELAKLGNLAGSTSQQLGGLGKALTTLSQQATAATRAIAAASQQLNNTKESTAQVAGSFQQVGRAASKASKEVADSAKPINTWVAQMMDGKRVLVGMPGQLDLFSKAAVKAATQVTSMGAQAKQTLSSLGQSKFPAFGPTPQQLSLFGNFVDAVASPQVTQGISATANAFGATTAQIGAASAVAGKAGVQMGFIAKTTAGVSSAFSRFTGFFKNVTNQMTSTTQATGRVSAGALAATRSVVAGQRAFGDFVKGVAVGMITYRLILGAINAVTGAIKGTIMASIDFEAAFANVRKVLDATEPEFRSMQKNFRELAKIIPLPIAEIVNIGVRAAQLGIAKEDVISFTKTMANLAATTDNLTSDEASMALARFANITKMSRGDFDKLGSAILYLGNRFAGTEKEIVNMSLRLAAAGKQVGMSEPQIIAFAAALTSVGVRAESGGTALSRVFIDIATQVATNGKKLQDFAKVVGNVIPGTTVAKFKQMFQKDAAGAISYFISGLGKMDKASGESIITLSRLGYSNIRTRDAILRLAESGGTLEKALTLGNKGWNESGYLAEKAGQRYGTAKAKIELFKNTVYDLAIDVGGKVVPSLINMTNSLRGIAQGIQTLAPALGLFSSLAKTALVFVGVLSGGWLINAIGGVTVLHTALRVLILSMSAGPFIALQRTLNYIGVSAGLTAVQMGLFGKAVVIAGAAFVATQWYNILKMLQELGHTYVQLDRETEDLRATNDRLVVSMKKAGLSVPKRPVVEGYQTTGKAAEAEQKYTDALMAVIKASNEAGKSIKDYKAVVSSTVQVPLTPEQEKLVEALGEAAQPATALATKMQELLDLGQPLDIVTAAYGRNLMKAAEEQTNLGQALDETTNKLLKSIRAWAIQHPAPEVIEWIEKVKEFKPAPELWQYIEDLKKSLSNLTGPWTDPKEESAFQHWYANIAKLTGLATNPDVWQHMYDYRKAFMASATPVVSQEDKQYHWPSEYKAWYHPNRYVGGVDTITNLRVSKETEEFGKAAAEHKREELEYQSGLLDRLERSAAWMKTITNMSDKELTAAGLTSKVRDHILDNLRETTTVTKEILDTFRDVQKTQDQIDLAGKIALVPSGADVAAGLKKNLAETMERLNKYFTISREISRASTRDMTEQLRLRLEMVDTMVPLNEEERRQMDIEKVHLEFALRAEEMRVKYTQIRLDLENKIKESGLLPTDPLRVKLETQIQDVQGALDRELGTLATLETANILKVHREEYLRMINTVRDEAGKVFDDIATRGKGAFTSLIDWLEGIFLTRLRALFQNLAEMIFTPSGSSGRTGWSRLMEGVVPKLISLNPGSVASTSPLGGVPSVAQETTSAGIFAPGGMVAGAIDSMKGLGKVDWKAIKTGLMATVGMMLVMSSLSKGQRGTIGGAAQSVIGGGLMGMSLLKGVKMPGFLGGKELSGAQGFGVGAGAGLFMQGMGTKGVAGWGEAIGGGALVGLILGGPLGAAIGAAIGALAKGIQAIVSAIKGKTSDIAGAMETARDFGVSATKEQFADFYTKMGLSEPTSYPIRKELTSSPQYLVNTLAPLAKAQGRMNEFLASLEHVQTAWGTFNFRAVFELGQATGDWTELDKAFVAAFQSSERLNQIMPDWKNVLTISGDAAIKTAGDFETLWETFAASGAMTQDFVDFMTDNADALDSVTKSSVLFQQQLEVARAAMAKYLEMKPIIEGFTGIKDTLVGFGDTLKKSIYQSFLDTGVITDELASKITQFGGDISAFQKLADISKISNDFETLVSNLNETGVVLPELAKIIKDFGGDLSVLDDAAQLKGLIEGLGGIKDLMSGLEGLTKGPIEKILSGEWGPTTWGDLSKMGLEPGKLTGITDLIAFEKNWDQSLSDFYDKTTKVWDEITQQYTSKPVGMVKGGVLEQGLYKFGGPEGLKAIELYKQGINTITPELLSKVKAAMDEAYQKEITSTLEYLGSKEQEVSDRIQTLINVIDSKLSVVEQGIATAMDTASQVVLDELENKILPALNQIVSNTVPAILPLTPPITPPIVIGGGGNGGGGEDNTGHIPIGATGGLIRVHDREALLDREQTSSLLRWKNNAPIAARQAGPTIIIQNVYGFDDFVKKVRQAGIQLKERGEVLYSRT